MADFGGAIGLWVGASMITMFEFGEYFLDMLILCCARCRRKGTRVSSNEQRPNGKVPPNPNRNRQFGDRKNGKVQNNTRYPGELRTVNEKFFHRPPSPAF